MTNPIPKRLRKEPLVEAVWQVYFEPEPNRPVGDILPGVLFTALRNQRADLQIHRLPLADIPVPVAALDPNLRYAAKYRIASPDWHFLFHVGDRVVTINCQLPYVGWDNFRAKIFELIDILASSALIPEPQHHALRYIDLLTLDPPPALKSLRLSLKIGDYVITNQPAQLRLELPDTHCRHVLQIVTPAQIYSNEGATQGTLIDLETLADLPSPSWPAVRDDLERLHNASKTLFFRQILTEEAINQMDPEY
jgi:uncharacterized protein (TIGR04255 family)